MTSSSSTDLRGLESNSSYGGLDLAGEEYQAVGTYPPRDAQHDRIILGLAFSDAPCLTRMRGS
jgi:hypothetical protein